MAIPVKDAASAAKKFAQRGQAASRDYTEGVRGAGQRWQSETAASADNYAAAVQEAIGRNAFARGVAASGGARYEAKATTIGAQRFGPGIAAAEDDWRQGVEPYLQAIAGITLEPRQPKGSPSNYRRTQQIGEALRARKLGTR